MSTDLEFTCERDGVPTRLRCANCDVPVCPLCFVRTEVGLRCPDCGRTQPGRRPARRRRPVPVVALVGALVLVAGVWVVLARQEASEPEPATPPRTQTLEFEDVPSPGAQQVPQVLPVPSVPPARQPSDTILRTVERPDLGLSFGIPTGWQVQAPDPAGSLFLAVAPAGGDLPFGWLRLFSYPPGEGVAVTAQRVAGELLAGRRGAGEVLSGPTFVGTRPAWIVRFEVPLNPDGSGPVTQQTYCFLQLDRGVAALAFGSLRSDVHAPFVQSVISTVRFP